ncbi:hypothetical protein SVAN01_07462 [Stagonosporopsis vannaccii]|nr:hypothetical protein SVAN01_07462 [Stagonosporopsis vannaccii]
MLSSTRNIYSQTFAAPGKFLWQKAHGEQVQNLKELERDDAMLLIQPRKHSCAIFDQDHARTHPASWQPVAQDTSAYDRATINAAALSSAASFSKSSIAALSLEQLQELSLHISDRIQIKKRYNNTPLRRIIARQSSGTPSSTPVRCEEDNFSQTDTLVNSEVLEVPRESAEAIRARYNSTPLRRILARQTSTEQRSVPFRNTSTAPRYEPEALEVRKARYNNTPLRRILSHQTCVDYSIDTSSSTIPSPVTPQRSVSTPVPRSNTPLRRILSRQTSTQTIPTRQKDEDELSDRADSVVSPDSPILSKTPRQPSALINLTSEARIRAYETALWGLTKPVPLTAAREQLNSEARIRAYEEAIWAKHAKPVRAPQPEESKGTTVTVTEVSTDAKKPKRIVVDSKGSPLRRILQRQTSRDWRAPARVGVV